MKDPDSQAIERLRQRQSEKWRTYPPDVLPAFVAEMDFGLAEPIRSALTAAVELGDSGYASPRSVRPAFASFAAARYGWQPDERCVFAVPDVMAGIEQALELLTEPGAGIAINPPVYPPFFETIRSRGRAVVEVPLLRDGTHWSLDEGALERAFAGGAAAYLLCSPHNPVGRCWTTSELETVVGLCRAYRVALIADEIHAPLILPGAQFVPAAALAAGLEYVVLHSASKGWNVAGLKCGLAICHPNLRDRFHAQLSAIPTQIQSRIGHLGVIASIAAFAAGEGWLTETLARLDRNRAILTGALSQHLPNVAFEAPEATYLAWLDCSAYGLKPDAAAAFLRDGRVAVESGSRFGTGGERFVRVNFATEPEILNEVVLRMARAVA